MQKLSVAREELAELLTSLINSSLKDNDGGSKMGVLAMQFQVFERFRS